MSHAPQSLVHLPVLLVFACLACLACQDPSAAIEQANKETVLQLNAAIDAQDYDRIRAGLSEDFVLHVVGMPEPFDREATFELMKAFYTAFPDLTHVVEDMIAEGDRVAVRLRFEGTHQGEFMGIPATGKKVSYAGVQMLTIVDGVCTENWALDDNLSFMTQLGMQLAPAELDS
jgi:steroid delta-isomerase-like uncharacterized protein